VFTLAQIPELRYLDISSHSGTADDDGPQQQDKYQEDIPKMSKKNLLARYA
jgi:hypothetical protein